MSLDFDAAFKLRFAELVQDANLTSIPFASS